MPDNTMATVNPNAGFTCAVTPTAHLRWKNGVLQQAWEVAIYHPDTGRYTGDIEWRDVPQGDDCLERDDNHDDHWEPGSGEHQEVLDAIEAHNTGEE